jgi:hypothetical protein
MPHPSAPMAFIRCHIHRFAHRLLPVSLPIKTPPPPAEEQKLESDPPIALFLVPPGFNP